VLRWGEAHVSELPELREMVSPVWKRRALEGGPPKLAGEAAGEVVVVVAAAEGRCYERVV
jgi:hypothetical protein